MRMRKRRVQNIEKKGKISMANYIFDKKGLQKIDKIKDLGDKICRFVNYYEKNKGQNSELAALADTLLSIKEIFKSHDEKFKKLEEHLKEKTK